MRCCLLRLAGVPEKEPGMIKDSGEQQEFKTGAVRDTHEGKGRYDLISVIFKRRLARHTAEGALKYGERNWEKGMPLSRCLDSAMRHLDNFLEGDDEEDHLAAAAWNLMVMIHVEEMIERGLLPEDLNDLPPSCIGE